LYYGGQGRANLHDAFDKVTFGDVYYADVAFIFTVGFHKNERMGDLLES
jgi:hypothetical protein